MQEEYFEALSSKGIRVPELASRDIVARPRLNLWEDMQRALERLTGGN